MSLDNDDKIIVTVGCFWIVGVILTIAFWGVVAWAIYEQFIAG